MKSKSKAKLGQQFTESQISWEEREAIVREYLNTNISKQAIWEKYTGQQVERGRLLRWINRLGLSDKNPKPIRRPMSKKSNKDKGSSKDQAQLEQRIAELEKALEEARLKALAYSKMIDIAEAELDISIRKKSNTKPSNK